jgi:L-fuculose-phosphate aldolase
MTLQDTKQELLDTAKELLRRGLVEGTAGNLSARLPDGNVVLTPSSLEYDVMTLDDLVVTDLDGNVVEGERPPTSEKALHLACLRRYEEIGAVIHSHAMYCSMFAVTHQPISCVIEEFSMRTSVAMYRSLPTSSPAPTSSRTRSPSGWATAQRS